MNSKATMNKQEIAERLYMLGYIPTWPPTPTTTKKAIESYLSFQSGMNKDIVELLQTRRCGIPDTFMMAEAAASRWQFLDVKYYQDIRFPGIDPDFISMCYDNAWKSWQAVCGLTPVKVLTKADSNVYASAARIDRPGNVLAYAYFPTRGVRTESQAQVYDLADVESYKHEAFLTATIAHETGHSLGLPHGPGGKCLMGPYITDMVVPQTVYDIPESIKRYGQFVGTPSPPTPPINPFPSFVGVW